MTSRWSLSRTFSGMSQARPENHDEPDVLPPSIDDLNDTQRAAFEKFKKSISESDLYRPEKTEEDGTWKPASHDTTTLLRFLRARQYDPEGALTQFKETEKWRKDVNLDASYDTMDVHEFMTAREVYPLWTGRRDKRGIPIFVYQVSALREKKLAEYNKPITAGHGPDKPKLMKLYAIYESLTQFVLPACNRVQANGAIPCTSNIVDISNVGLWTFWNLKSHMQEASELATARYPETLDRIFILGAPSGFSTVWGWIKKWFDPITVSKIFVLGPSEVLPTLSRFIDIESIPKKYGGKLDWEYGDLPIFDDELKKIMGDMAGPEGLKQGPIRYIVGKDHDEIRAKGSVDGKQRDDLVSTIKNGATGDEADSEAKAPATTADDKASAEPAPVADNKSVTGSVNTEKAPASLASGTSTEAFPSVASVASVQSDEDSQLRDRAVSASAIEGNQEAPSIAGIMDSKTTPPSGTMSPHEGTGDKLRNLASRFKADIAEKMHFHDGSKSAPSLVKVAPAANGTHSVVPVEEAKKELLETAPARPALNHVDTNVPVAALAPSENEKIQEKTVALSELKAKPENVAPTATEAIDHEAPTAQTTAA